MGCRIIEGKADGSRECAVFFCSVTGMAFGPLMEDTEEAEAFVEWLKTQPAVLIDTNPPRMSHDPRAYSIGELKALYHEFREEAQAESAMLQNDSLGDDL